ncbi:hypothetical protein IKF84_02300 [Candidatus Saccharibacteria bacterium]|nr:hypothetical protein [Candidatus Saccharibacteria bacterium]
MNKRYIDFVPVDRRGGAKPAPIVAKKPVAKQPAARKSVAKQPVARKPVVKQPVKESVEKPIIASPKPVATFSRNASGKAAPQLGVIEDYHPKFVQTEVKKRPLGTKPAVKPATRTVAKSATKAAPVARATGGVRTSSKVVSSKAIQTGAVQANFINVGKVEKRPLSKNVYTKKATAVSEAPKESVKEKSKKPVVIIAKPEKDSKVGLIVAVILTIILGAAAGTVAFLLLPK